MSLDQPTPFQEALDAAKVKSLLPTTGKTADLRQLETAIKQHALWSATVESLDTLRTLATGVDAILAGTSDGATVALDLKNVLDAQGYNAAPEDVGTLRDVASFERRSLMIDTQVAMARGAGWYDQGMQPEVLDEFPAQELFRANSPKGGAKAERNWAARWEKLGGTFYDARMIALKTDPIWAALGDPANFPDALGNNFAPFAINSGMRTRDIGRDEAESIGLLDASTQLTPAPLDLSADLQAAPDVREDWLRSAIEDSGLGTFDSQGVLHFNQGAAA